MLSMPILINNMPKKAKVLRSLLVPKIKRYKVYKNFFEFNIRYCIYRGLTIMYLSESHCHACLTLFFYKKLIYQKKIIHRHQNSIFLMYFIVQYYIKKDRFYVELPLYCLEWFISNVTPMLLLIKRNITLQKLNIT